MALHVNVVTFWMTLLMNKWTKIVMNDGWVSQWCRPHDAYHMVVNLCHVLNPCFGRCWESEDARLTNQEEGRWASRCWKPKVSLRVYKSMGSSPNSANKIMIGCRRTHFDVRHRMYLHALLENLPLRVFQVPSWISLPCVKVGCWPHVM
jgi:hypothetical protein